MCVYVYVCVCVCMYVCMTVCVHVCMCFYANLCVCVCMYVGMCVCIYVCVPCDLDACNQRYTLRNTSVCNRMRYYNVVPGYTRVNSVGV